VAHPTRLLGEGEEVVLDLRPHWTFLARPLVLTLASVGVAIAAFVIHLVPKLGVEAALALVWVGIRYLRWATTSFVVTSQRIVLRRGVLGRHVREILLGRVNDVAYDQRILQRAFGWGRLFIESGGEWGQELVTRVPRPAAVQRQVLGAIEAAHGAGQGRGSSLSIPEQLEQLDNLCRRGIISRTEHDAKRAQLLERW
jgi:membrane protein YdbS with pleckstrin-like domain